MTAPATSQGKASSSTAGKPVRTAPAPAPEPSPSKSYTPEQVEQVRNVRAAGKDYYKILGVPKDCEDAQLKKAYRKVSLGVCSLAQLQHVRASAGSPRWSDCSPVVQLAVKLHPDKWCVSIDRHPIRSVEKDCFPFPICRVY